MAISGDYEYVVINGEAHITRYLGNDKHIIIPSTLDGYPVTETRSYIGGRGAFSDKGILSVQFPEGFKVIDSSSFSHNLIEDVEFPSTLTTIRGSAFLNNEISEVYLGENITLSIGGFSGPYLNKVEVHPDNTEIYSIDNKVIIDKFNNLVQGTISGFIPNEINRIRDDSFGHMIINRVVIPEDVNQLDEAFDGGLVGELEVNNKDLVFNTLKKQHYYIENVVGYVNSTASQFANDNSIPFTSLIPEVVGITNPEKLTVDIYDFTDLPERVEIQLSGGGTYQAIVTWDDVPEIEGTHIVKGALSLPGDIRNPNSIKAEIEVEVLQLNVTNIESVPSVSIDYGESYEPPNQLNVTYSDGNHTRVELTDVSWESYDELAESQQTISGELLLRDAYKNTNNLQPSYKITVEKRTVESVEEIDNQTVEYTTSFDIPSEVEITLDNDDKINVDVIDLSRTNTVQSDKYFTHTYEYSLDVPDYYIYDDVTYTFTIRVNKRYVEKVDIISAQNVSYGTQFENLQLPPSINVDLSDGTNKRYNIDWINDGYSPSQPTSQVINGTLVINDTDVTYNKNNLQPNIVVTVQDSYVKSKQPDESQEIYIFDKDDKFLNVLSVDNGLISTWFKDYKNDIPDEAFRMVVDSESELIHLIKEENQLAFYINLSVLGSQDQYLRLFRIKEINERNDGEGYIVEVLAEPSYLELYDHFIEDRRIENGNVQTALNRALEGSRWSGHSFLTTTNETTNFYWINAMEALEKIVEVWGGVLFDIIALDDTNEINFKVIYLVPRLGGENGLLIQPDYNAETIERRTLSYPKTAMWGQGASLETDNGGFTRYITFEEVEWKKSNGDPVDKPKGQKWVGDPEALSTYGYLEDGVRDHREGHFSNQDYDDPEDLLWATWEYLQLNKHPEVTYVFEIYETEKPIFLGDTVVALDRHYGKPIEVQAEISGLEYDILYPDEKTIIVGDHKTLRDPTDDRLDDVNDRLNGVENRPSQVGTDSYPNKKPEKPIEVIAEGGYRNIDLYWRYTDEIFVKKYEVYGSTIKDFEPSENNLLWEGNVSAMTHVADMDETWYFRVAAVNYHGTRSDFSNQVSASTARDITPDILFGSIKAEQLEDMLDLAGKLSEGTLDWIADDTIERIDATQLGIEEMVNDITSNLANDIAHLQNRADGLDGELTDVFSELDEIEGRFTQVINNISNIDGVIEEHESLIEQNEQAILERVTHSELNTVENTFSQSIAEVETRANEISNRVTQVNTRIDNIDLSGTNFITHLPENWEQGSLSTSGANLGSASNRVRLKDYHRVDSNTTYTIQAYGDYNLRVTFYTESKSHISGFYRTDEISTLTTPSNARYFRAFILMDDNSDIDPYDVGESVRVKLSLGSDESGWTPNLDDTGQLVSNVQTYVAEFNIRADGIEQIVGSIEEEMGVINGKFTAIEQDMGQILLEAKEYVIDELGEISEELISFINISPEGIKIKGDRISIDGQTDIKEGVIGTAAIANAAIDKAHLKNAIIDNAHIISMSGEKLIFESVKADKLNVSNLSAVSSNLGTVTAGILRSRNDNMELNLNTGKLRMRRANFELGNGADIFFTDLGNRLYYQLRDPVAGAMRAAGVGIGRSINNRFPFVYMGTSTASKPHANDDSNFYGFIANTYQRRIIDGIGNSVIGHVFHIRDKAVSFNKGWTYNLVGNNLQFYGMSTGSYNYDLGKSGNLFRHLWLKGNIRVSGGYIDIKNSASAYSGQGFRLETAYDGASQMAFYGLNANEHYNLGKSNRRFSYVYLRYQPNVSSDRNLKDNINKNTLGLDFVKDINTYTFTMLSDPDKWVQSGFIAQQVKQVLHAHDHGHLSMVKYGDDGMLAIEHGQMIAPVYNAVNQLDDKIEKHYSKFESRLSKVEKENKQLKAKMSKLEAA